MQFATYMVPTRRLRDKTCDVHTKWRAAYNSAILSKPLYWPDR